MARDRELRVRILGDSTSAERAFKRTSDASDKIGPSGKVAQNAIDNVSNAISSRLGPAAGVADDALRKITGSALSSGSALKVGLAGGALAAAGGIAAFAVSGVNSLVSLAGEVRNFQRASGASVAESSRFVAVLDDMGISAETGATAVFKLGKTAEKAPQNLAAVGVAVAKAKDGTTDLTETLLNAADAYAAQPDPAKRAEIAFAAFGKQGQALIPILEQGRKGLKEFFKDAEDSGQILSPKDLADTRKYELAIDDLGDAVEKLKRRGGRTALPFVTGLAETGSQVVDIADQVTTGLSEMADKSARVFDKISFGTLGKSAKEQSQEAAEGADDYAESAEGVAASAALQKEALVDAAAAWNAVSAENTAAARAIDGLVESLDKQTQAVLASVNSGIAYERAQNGLEDANQKAAEAQVAYNAAVKEHGRNSGEAKLASEALARAHLDTKASYVDLGEAAVRQADDAARASGKQLSEVDKSNVFRDTLIKLKDALAPGSEMRTQLEAIINMIPERKNVVIGAEVDPSLAATVAAVKGDLASILAGPVAAPAAVTGQRSGAPRPALPPAPGQASGTVNNVTMTVNGSGLSPEVVADIVAKKFGWSTSLRSRGR